SVVSVTEQMNHRAPASVDSLVKMMAERNLLPPNVNLSSTKGVLVSTHATIYLRYRIEPVGIEVVSAERGTYRKFRPGALQPRRDRKHPHPRSSSGARCRARPPDALCARLPERRAALSSIRIGWRRRRARIGRSDDLSARCGSANGGVCFQTKM